MRLYENISSNLNKKINEKLNRMESDFYTTRTTQRERQFAFLTFLQSLPLSGDQVFNIYTNTKLK